VLRALVLLTATVALRAAHPATGLSYDEIQSITHATQNSLPAVLASVRHFDPHPPFYYLQLHGWFALTGVSQVTARANSWFVSALCCAALYAAASHSLGEPTGFRAAVLFAVMPYAVVQGDIVRMYGILMLLAVLLWVTTFAALKSVSWIRPAAAMAVVNLTALATHGGAVLLWLSGSTLIASWFLEDPVSRRPRAAAVAAVHLACIVPAAAHVFSDSRGSLRHTLVPDAAELARTAFELLTAGPRAPVWAAVVALGALAGLVLCASHDRRTRLVAIAFLITPFAAGVVLSYIVTPIWLTRTFAFTVPFLSLAGAVAVDRVGRHVPGRTAVVTGIVVLTWLGLLVGVRPQSEDEPRAAYRSLIRTIAEHAGPHDRVLVDSPRARWAVTWYAAGRTVSTAETSGAERLPGGRLLVLADRTPADLPGAPDGTVWWLIESEGAGEDIDLVQVLQARFPDRHVIIESRTPVLGLQLLGVRC
jgi:hypothetical protein